MTYTLNGRKINIPDKELAHLMKSLELTREEAIETWLDDNDYTTNDEQDALDKEAGKVKIDYGVDNKAKGEKKPRERKVDAEKGYLLDLIRDSLPNGVERVEMKTETEVSFIYNGNRYTVKLTKHRPPKG